MKYLSALILAITLLASTLMADEKELLPPTPTVGEKWELWFLPSATRGPAPKVETVSDSRVLVLDTTAAPSGTTQILLVPASAPRVDNVAVVKHFRIFGSLSDFAGTTTDPSKPVVFLMLVGNAGQTTLMGFPSCDLEPNPYYNRAAILSNRDYVKQVRTRGNSLPPILPELRPFLDWKGLILPWTGSVSRLTLGSLVMEYDRAIID